MRWLCWQRYLPPALKMTTRLPYPGPTGWEERTDCPKPPTDCPKSPRAPHQAWRCFIYSSVLTGKERCCAFEDLLVSGLALRFLSSVFVWPLLDSYILCLQTVPLAVGRRQERGKGLAVCMRACVCVCMLHVHVEARRRFRLPVFTALHFCSLRQISKLEACYFGQAG